jgi:endonuclease YncB( thermonuclease family)
MKIRSLVVPLAVVGAFAGAVAWLIFAEPPALPEPETVSSQTEPAVAARPENDAAPLAPSVPPQEEQAAASPPDAIRDVSPDGVSAPQVTGELTRVGPSERLLELLNPPVEPVPDGPLELVRVEVPDAGHLKSGRLTVRLAHIESLDLEATCKTEMGASWPCGMRARTFLRALIRRLKVSCVKQEDLAPQEISAVCTRGAIDLSSQLVRFGWATPLETAPDKFKELAEAAKAKEIGQWQTEWLTDLPQADWAEPSALNEIDLEQLAPNVVDWSLRTLTDGTTENSGAGEEQPEVE